MEQGHDQGQQQVGNQGEQQAGYRVDGKPAFPAQRQGVEGVGHPALEQIAEEELHIQQGVDEVDDGHAVGCETEGVGGAAGAVGIEADHEGHQQTHRVETPAWGKPGDVLFQDGEIKG